MDKGSRALRSTTLATPPEELDEVPKEQVELDDEQAQANATYASLKGHPGWELIKQDFERTIASYRSGSYMPEFIKGHTREEIGDKVIISNMVADELEMKILTVEGAALALEQDGKSRPKRGN